MKSISFLVILIGCLLLSACQSKVEKGSGELLDGRAPEFTLTDLNGNEVSLASLKGKTVILDFWATWCGPCKKSFPVMQQVVNKYQDDPNVVFFFVNTWEKGLKLEERKEKISQFMQVNGYNFHVLLDVPLKTESGEYIKNVPESYKVAKDYKITSIPTRVVIGPEGNQKFIKAGCEGTVAEIYQELEMTRKLIDSSSTNYPN